MKEICFLIGNIDNSGGTERVTTLIANELVKMNYKVSIISLTGGTHPFFEPDSRIKTFSLYSDKVSFKTNFFGVVWSIRKIIKKHKIDTLVVVDSISCIFTVPALYGLKVSHICWEHFNFNVNLGVRLRDFGRKLAARYCDYVITLTKRDKEIWEGKLKRIKAIIIPISNPIPYKITNHTPSLEYKTVLAIGRLTYQKGFDLLIDAWALVCKNNSDWVLHIVGSGEDEKNLKIKTKSLGIDNRVDFLPPTKDVEKHYTTCSFYCLSSRFEGLPMVLLEAQAFALPIVAFDCDTGPAEIIHHKKNGLLIKDLNVTKLSQSILELINSESMYRKMVANTKGFSEEFSIYTIIEKWKKIL